MLGPTPSQYTYTYQVTSERSSGVGVNVFGIAPVPPPDSMSAPDQWMGGYGYEEKDNAAVWACVDTLTEPPAGHEDGFDYSSPYEIQPGETKVFVLVSRHPPTRSVSFYAQGFDSLPEVGTYLDEGDTGGQPVPVRYAYPSLFRVGVTGSAIGPSIRGR